MRRIPLLPAAAALAASLAIMVPRSASAADVADYQARTFRLSATKTLPYRLFIPKDYDKTKKYPLMLHLHGAGERGTDNTSQLFHKWSNFWADDSLQALHPSFVVAPQCPPDPQRWIITPTYSDYESDKIPLSENLKAVLGILDSMAREFNIDQDRIYATGMSMGGCGTWYLICQHTNRFAAAAPVCGGGDPRKKQALAELPIWIHHAADDPSVPIAYGRQLFNEINSVGKGKIRFTEYPASYRFGHESWKPAAINPEVHRWIYAQKRAAPVTLARAGSKQAARGRTLLPGARPAAGLLAVDARGRLRLTAEPDRPVVPAFLLRP